VLAPLLPTRAARGRPPRDERQVLNGVLWVLATGSPWRDLPERHGPWQTCYHRFNAWAKDGNVGPRFDREVYRGRNVVERAVGWLMRWRRLATRADELAVCYHAAICVVLVTRYAALRFSDTTWR
jgi:transposase